MPSFLARASGGPTARLKDNNFDALRLLFASMVVLYHTSVLSAVPALGWIQNYVSATFAVQAFFVVSGFLVTMSFERSSTLRSYASKRIRRIFPAYLVVVIGSALLLSLLSSLPAHQYFTQDGFWRYLGYNLILSNFRAPDLPGVFTGNPQHAIDGSLWTIKIEVGFYLLVPLIVWALRRFGYRRVLPLVFIASVCWQVGLDALATNSADFYAKLAKQLPGQLSFFVGGAWAYYRTTQGRALGVIPALLGVVAYLATSGLVHEAVAPVAVSAIVWWAALCGPRLPAVGKHGDFSYGIYLYHFPIVQACIALGVFAYSPALAIGLVALTALSSAVASWFLIESPALQHGRHVPALTARTNLVS